MTSAVPFEEDTHDPKIWFMDHSYMETMSTMFRKVNGTITQNTAMSLESPSSVRFACNLFH